MGPPSRKKPVKGPHREDDYRTKTLQGVGALDSIGEGLRAAREAQGHTIHDVSLATRIRASYVEALEADDFAALGGDVYVKGFLRSYAAYLGLDPEPLIAEYRDRYTTETPPGMRLQSMRDSGVLASKEPRRRGWLPLGIGCVLVVLLLGVWSMVVGRGDPASAPTVAAPETTLAPPPSTTMPPTTAPTTTLVSGEVEVVLRFEARSWASVKVDGEQAFRGVLSKGAERSFTGTQAVDVSLGNGGGVLLTVNGTDLGRAGPYGRAFQRTFTAQQQEPASGDGQETGQTSVTQATRRTVGTTRRYTQPTNATRTTSRTTARTTGTTRASDTSDSGDEFDEQPDGGTSRRKAATTTTEPDDEEEHDQ